MLTRRPFLQSAPHLRCDTLGPTRLLFGSDYPLFSQRRALRNVSAALSVSVSMNIENPASSHSK